MKNHFASLWKEDLNCCLGYLKRWHIDLLMILAALLGVGHAYEPMTKWQMKILHLLECTVVELWMGPFDGET
jgi:hypothetical protein